MADVVLSTGRGLKRVSYLDVAASTVVSLNLSGTASAAAEFSNTADSANTVVVPMESAFLKVDLANNYVVSGLSFKLGVNVPADEFIAKANGDIERNLNSTTGIGTKVGKLTPQTGEIKLTSWPANTTNSGVTQVRGAATAPPSGIDSPYNTYAVTFRLATSPIRPSSFQLLGTLRDGTTFNVAANADGVINATRVKGRINYETGVVTVVFVTPDAPAGMSTTDISFLEVPGVSDVYIDLAKNETLRYNAVAYTYLPLDANLLGINPIRLPSDGRVPIFRPGGVAVIGYTKTTTPVTVANGDTIETDQERLSRVVVRGHDGIAIVTGYTVDYESGVVTFTDVTGYSQPVRVEARIEDAGLIRDAQIDGTISVTRPLSHNFPIGSYVSSAYMANDLFARVPLVFDQKTWSPQTFTDALVGDAAVATYNTGNYPIEVKNDGASTERFALLFTSPTVVSVIGEDLGVILTGAPITADIAPINPATGQPYFTIRKEGWGGGWIVGNVLRVNTVGALASFWTVRTVKQGAATGEDYTFSLLARGDVDNPL